MVDHITDDMFTTGSQSTCSETSLSWLKKYCPKDFTECLLKPDEKKQMTQWMEFLTSNTSVKEPSKKKGKSSSRSRSKNKLDTNCLFLHGPPGIGKTTIATLLFKKYNFDVLEFNASDTRTAKTIQDRLDKVGGSHNVIDFMCNKKTKIAIILDEIDGLSSGDKGGMSEINSIIAESRDKNTPFICISNNICKKTDALKRKSLYVKVSKPSDIIIKNIITKISKLENIDLQPETLKKLIAKSQGDIRRCITLLEYIFRNQGQNKKNSTPQSQSKGGFANTTENVPTITENITMKIDFTNRNDNEIQVEEETQGCEEETTKTNIDIDEEIENYSRKLTELQPYEMCEKILNSCKTLEFFLENFNYDQSMTNWYIYENFVKYIDKNRVGNLDKKINSIEQIFKCFTYGDILEKEIMIGQNFDFFEYINIIKTHGSSFWTNYELKRTSYNKMGMMNYSTLLNRTSLEYSNSKGWGNINLNLELNGDTNITTELCNIIYKKLEIDDTEYLENVIKRYSITPDLMEKIIKSSSFYDKSQTSVFTNLKKKIKLYYSN